MSDPCLEHGLHEIAVGAASLKREHRFWLIDPTLGDVAEAHFDAWPDLHRYRLAVAHPDVPRGQAPYLIEAPRSQWEMEKFLLTGAQVALNEANVELPAGSPRPRRACAFIASEADGRALAIQLGQAATVTTVAAEKRLFRFWDPRGLGKIYDSEVLRPLLDFKYELDWLYFDGLSRFRHCSIPALARGGQTRKALSAKQEAELRLIGECNRVIESLRSTLRETPDSISEEVVRESVLVAATTGLVKTADRLAFAVARVQQRAPIEYASQIVSMISAASQGASYLALQQELTAEDWSAVVADSLRIQARHRMTGDIKGSS